MRRAELRRNPNLRFTDYQGAQTFEAPDIASEPNLPWSFGDLSAQLAPATPINANLSINDRVKILGMTVKLNFEGTVENQLPHTEQSASPLNHSMHNITDATQQLNLQRMVQVPHRKLLRLYWVMYRGPPLANAGAYVDLFEDRYLPEWRNTKTNDEAGLHFDGSSRGDFRFRRARSTMKVIKKMVIREPGEPTQFTPLVSQWELTGTEEGTPPTVTTESAMNCMMFSWGVTRYHPAKRFKLKIPNVFRAWYRNAHGVATVVEDPPIFFLLALYPSWRDRWGLNYVRTIGNSCPMFRFNYDTRVWWTLYRSE